MCALSSTTYKNTFTCIGGTTYDATFKIFDDDDVEVVYVSTAGVESTLIKTSSYSISLITSVGFRVTTVPAYANGTLVVRRNQALKQEADFEANGDFPTDTLENQLDKMVMMIQGLDEQIQRSILGAATQTTALTLPTAVANKLIGWNSGGTGLENKTAIDDDVAAAAAASASAAAVSAAAAAVSAAAAAAVAGWTVASQVEAEAGTDNTKVMTPLRTAQAIAVQAVDETTWADYSGTSTIVGFTGTITPKQIYYKKIGKTVFVAFQLAGESNTTTLTFTLPYASASTVTIGACVRTVDNGIGTTGGGLLVLATGSSVVSVFKDMNTAVWTASGTKNVYGQFFYETT